MSAIGHVTRADGVGHSASHRPRPDAAPGFDGWQKGVWVGVACAFALMVIVLLIIVAYTLNTGQQVFASHASEDLAFTFSGMSLITLGLLRLLAIFFGAALSFGGLVVSFYVHAHQTHATGESGGIKASLSTNSPGIAAIVVGAVVIIASLFARGVNDYDAADRTVTTTTTTSEQQPPTAGETKPAVQATPGKAPTGETGHE